MLDYWSDWITTLGYLSNCNCHLPPCADILLSDIDWLPYTAHKILYVAVFPEEIMYI